MKANKEKFFSARRWIAVIILAMGLFLEGIPQNKTSLFTVEDLQHDTRTPSQRSASPMISQQSETWIGKPQKDWPQITMINQIEYVDKSHPIAACSFLLETEQGVFAVTAKHVLTYFKSPSMTSVSFGDRLKRWIMFPKNNPADVVEIEAIVNEDPGEPIDRTIPSNIDWLVFSIKTRSPHIQPLKLRVEPLEPGENVYIVGWRYSDKDRPQVIYEGNYVESIDGAVIISTKILSDNKTPGLSGSPVIDAHGHLIGIMSQKYGKSEKLGSIHYPKRIIEARYR